MAEATQLSTPEHESSPDQKSGPKQETNHEHLLSHLRDVHAIEVQALRQLSRAVERADDESRATYEAHLEETKGHEQKIKELVEAEGHASTVLEDKTLRGGTIGLRQLADIPLDSPAKLAMNLFALEHLEIAAYELLAEIAGETDGSDAAQAAESILKEEREAAEKVAGLFDRAAELWLEQDSDVDQLLVAHLQDIHAIEQQSLQLLQIGVEEVCQDEELKQSYSEHVEQTEEHERLVKERIEAHEAKPSAIRDLHMSTAKSGLHDLLKEPPDAAVKLVMNLYCVEHLEVAAYELLKRMAEQAGDSETADLAEQLLQEERDAAETVKETFKRCVELMLASDRSYEAVRAGEAPKDDGEASKDDA